MNVFTLIIEHDFSNYAGIVIVGNNIDDHAMLVARQNTLAFFEKILYKLLLVKVPVNTIIFDKMAAPSFFSSEESVTQKFVPLETFFN